MYEKILPGRKLGLVDVGASGGLEPRWQPIGPALRSFLFEPDERSYRDLVGKGASVFQTALDRAQGSRDLFLCRKPQVSSFIEPEAAFVGRFPDSARFDVLERVPVTTDTMDRCLGDQRDLIDFIKLDTQGSELFILEGAQSILAAPVVGLEVEVEFVALYRDQPLFGDVCAFLKARGYEFFDFVNLYRWERTAHTYYGQAVFGDALFLRTPESFADLLTGMDVGQARDKALAYCTITGLYDRVDLLPVCLGAFGSFLDASDRANVVELQTALANRRRKISFIIRLANRFLRKLGQHALTFQWS